MSMNQAIFYWKESEDMTFLVCIMRWGFFTCRHLSFHRWLVYGVLRHFQQYFSSIVAVGFIGGGNRSSLTLSHNVVSPEQDSNSQR
jgi:hypothetical protein